MKPKQVLKIVIDVAMTVLLLLLMAYSLVGEAAHEWLGVAMFVLFVTHHVLNSGWCRSLFKGRYPPFRVFQTALVLLVLIFMVGSMASGVVLSRYVLDLNVRGLSSLRDFWNYMLLRYHFVFFDFEEPLALFLLDYVAVMGLFVCIGHYAAKGLRKLQQSAGRSAKDKQ